MNRYVPVSKLVCLCLFFTIQTTAQTGNHIANEIIVKFKPGTDENTLSELRTQIQAQQKKGSSADKMQTWTIPENVLFLKGQYIQSIQDHINYLNQQPSVAYAEPNYIINVFNIPNDPQLNEHWGLKTPDKPAAYQMQTLMQYRHGLYVPTPAQPL